MGSVLRVAPDSVNKHTIFFSVCQLEGADDGCNVIFENRACLIISSTLTETNKQTKKTLSLSWGKWHTVVALKKDQVRLLPCPWRLYSCPCRLQGKQTYPYFSFTLPSLHESNKQIKITSIWYIEGLETLKLRKLNIYTFNLYLMCVYEYIYNQNVPAHSPDKIVII